MIEHSGDDQERFDYAVNEVLLAARVILGKARLCPACFASALAGALTGISEQYEHNITVPELSESEIALFKAQIAMGEVAGSA